MHHHTQPVYVMPSTSGRAATYPKRSDKLKFFYELKDLRDKRRLERMLPPAIEVYKETDPSTLTGTDQQKTFRSQELK